MARGIRYYRDEARHRANNAARWGGGTLAKQGFNFLTNASATNIAVATETIIAESSVTWWQAAGRAVSTYGMGAIGIILGTGLKFYLNHKEMQHQNHQLMNMYRHEFAAKLDKATSQVTDMDLHLLAQDNPTLQEEIDRNRHERNLKTIAWGLAATVATAAVVATMVLAVTGTITLLPALAIGFGVGLPVHWVAESAFEKVGERLTGLDRKTTLEQILSIERDQSNGQTISQERVMATYVSASPDLQEMIEKEFGKPYHHLALNRQHEVILRYGQEIGLVDMTQAINERRISAKELTFAVHGDRSNAYPEPTLYNQVREKVQHLRQHLEEKRQKAAERWDQFSHHLQEKKTEIAHKVADTSQQWVSRLGLAPKTHAPEQSWAAQVSANSNAPDKGVAIT